MEQFLNKIKDIRCDVEKALTDYPLPEFPASLYEPVKYSLVSGGKKFRPALLILTGEAFGVKRRDLMPAALAVEILHTFSLVHDDIMDGDSQRRGKPTIHVKWDENTAILSGDTLMSMAFNSLMQTQTEQSARIGLEFSQAMTEICEGQALDTEFESRLDVTTDEYLTMIRKKTGRLLALSCQLGALIAGCDDEVVENLYNFGIEIGLAFQIQDDLLEIMSDETKMGKSLGSDFVLGKKTYPLIETLSELSDFKKDRVMQFLKDNQQNRAAIHNVFKESGSIARSEKLVAQLFETAQKRLTQLPSSGKSDLEHIVKLIAGRKS